MAIYISQADYNYFEQLLNGLADAEQLRFLALLKQAGSEQAGVGVTMIRVVDDSALDNQVVTLQEMITRTIVEKAYKATKEGK